MAQYFVKDSENQVVTDSAQIEYLKFINMRHVVLGCMIGDFNDEGLYVIDPEIVKELISMPKYYVDTVDNIEICHSLIKLDKQLSFLVTMEGNRAVLSLAEKINLQANYKLNSGVYSNVNEYILDVVETSGMVDKNVLYKRWNISPYTGTALDVFDMDEETLANYFHIVNRFKYLLKANTLLLASESKMEAIEAQYANSTMGVLAHYPNLKKAVEDALAENVKGKPEFVCADKPYYFKTINEILDKAIENNFHLLSEKEQSEFLAEHKDVKTKYNIDARSVLDLEEKQVTSNREKSVVAKMDVGKNDTLTLKEDAVLFMNIKAKIAESLQKGKPLSDAEAIFIARYGLEVKKEQAMPKADEKPTLVAAVVAKTDVKKAEVKADNAKSDAKKPEVKKAGAKKDSKKDAGKDAKKTNSSTANNELFGADAVLAKRAEESYRKASLGMYSDGSMKGNVSGSTEFGEVKSAFVGTLKQCGKGELSFKGNISTINNVEHVPNEVTDSGGKSL